MDFEHAETKPRAVSVEPLQSPSTSESDIASTAPGDFRVIRRNGKVTAFDGNKIKVALTKAFLAVEGNSAAASTRIHDSVEQLTEQVVAAVTRRMPAGGATHIEDIQDHVELALMRAGHHKVARSYVLYRDVRAKERQTQQRQDHAEPTTDIAVTLPDGDTTPLDVNRLLQVVEEACEGLSSTKPGALYLMALRKQT